LFDRAAAYRECRDALDPLLARLDQWSEAEARRQLRLWQKSLAAIVAIDYFPGEAREQTQRAASEAEASVARHFSPDEPLPRRGASPAGRGATIRAAAGPRAGGHGSIASPAPG